MSSSEVTNLSKLSSSLACYGSGMAGYVKSNCPNCNKVISSSSVDFCLLSIKDSCGLNSRLRPFLFIDILGAHGTGILDTAVKQSMAGHYLYRVLLSKGQSFTMKSL